MSADSSSNMVILIAVGAFIVLVIILKLVPKRPKKEDSSSSASRSEPGRSSEASRIYETKEVLPKLPRNETLYQIIKNGTLNINAIPFDIFYVMDEVASLLRSDVQSDEVELLFDVSPKIDRTLLGSPKRLSRILINLIENGVANTESGVVIVKVEKVGQDNSSCLLRFSVSDQGRGMDEAMIESLYTDPQERGEEESKGLGFYVSNALVRSEKGNLTVMSTPGLGTTVAFELPFSAQPRSSEKRVPSANCSEVTVAVVEQHEEAAQLMKNALTPYMGEVQAFVETVAMDEAERYKSFDMVIMDHKLLTQALAQVLKAEGIWLIETESILEKTPQEAKAAVAVDYLISKPFTQEHVIEMLTVFYGAQTVEVSEETKAETSESLFDNFVSDAQIPVAQNVSKKDFNAFAGSKVLIVEDNPINQRVIRGLLGDSGISLFFAENGLDALDVLEAEAPFDLVLMDINMPVLDGLETTRRIRSNAQYDTMPVVAFTGLNIQEQIDKMREVGMNAHMAKPLNIGRVYSIFSHYLAAQREASLSA